jgi:predicted Fe-Mo cluster-binding NifX family protein
MVEHQRVPSPLFLHTVEIFIIYDSGDFNFTNYSYSPQQGSLVNSGIHFGKVLADKGVDVFVVSGIAIQFARMLGSYGIKIYECISATASEAVDGLKLNILQRIDTNSGESPPGPSLKIEIP